MMAFSGRAIMTRLIQSRGWIWGMGAAGAMLALAVVPLGMVATRSAQAQTYSVLHSFTGAGGDGAYPTAGLVRDAAGNLYGTTESGGGGASAGTVFKLDTTGTETVLHTFAGGPTDGEYPSAPLVADSAGDLYGTTLGGGTYENGSVFRVRRNGGTEQTLHSFTGSPSGARPLASLVLDPAGNLYGTTYFGGDVSCGGSFGCGTVFELRAGTGRPRVLHSFGGNTADGFNPVAGLVRDAVGNLYGTTYYGGTSGLGTVFKVDASGTETVLHNFSGAATDGANPAAGLVRDEAGNLYGTTVFGGASDYGVIFDLSTSGKVTVLHSFSGVSDGGYPQAGLVRDATGILYGTAGIGSFEFGVVFKLDRAGDLTVLHNFAGYPADGANPLSGLIRDAAGNLYGTTNQGGTDNYGTVFKIAP
jgi:uncharacterized repeat protein (TIGR03803 family)